MPEKPADLSSDLIDLSDLSLHDVDKLGDTALGTALRRILDDPHEPMAGFSAMT
jgi:FXSXX-COOH protein